MANQHTVRPSTTAAAPAPARATARLPRATTARTRESDKHPQRRATDAPAQHRAATPIEASNSAAPADVDLTLEPPPRPGPFVKVRATKVGYFGEKLRRVGDVFTVSLHKGPDRVVPGAMVNGVQVTPDKTVKGTYVEFSPKWMVRVDGGEPERTTGSAEALRQEHDAIQAGRLTGDGKLGPAAERPTGADDPLGADV